MSTLQNQRHPHWRAQDSEGNTKPKCSTSRPSWKQDQKAFQRNPASNRDSEGVLGSGAHLDGILANRALHVFERLVVIEKMISANHVHLRSTKNDNKYQCITRLSFTTQ